MSNPIGTAQTQTITITVKPATASKGTAGLRNGRAWMSFTTEPGKTYQILASTNFSEWTVVDETEAASTTLEYTDPQPILARFFTRREKPY